MEASAEPLMLKENLAQVDPWRRWYIPLAVIVLFAAGILSFARLQWNPLPADQRVNNGGQPTFFAFHILPSYNFSEDFYLYYVRAKRIAERGWSDSLFYHRPGEGSNYAAPVQVALSRLALLTDGRPLPYSIYMFATLAVGWSVLFAAARWWLPSEVRSSSLLMAVLLTVLFESLQCFVQSPEATFGVWPAFRGLRMSTMSWTNPVLVATLICATSLAFDRHRWRLRLAALMLMLAALAGTDNWAFAIAWFSTGLTTIWIAFTAVLRRIRSGAWPTGVVGVVVGMLLVCGAVLLAHHLLNRSLDGDVLLRSGFGAEWQNSVRPAERVMRVREWFVQQALLPLIVVLFGALVICTPSARGSLWPQPRWRLDGSAPKQFGFLAVLTLASTLLLYEILKFQGLEPFLRNQLFWRLNYLLLFALALSTLEWWRETLTASAASRSSMRIRGAIQPSCRHGRLGNLSLALLPKLNSLRPSTWASAMTLGIAILLAYHIYRINWFVSNVAARHFFLTADAERLRPWLEEFERQHGPFDLATASLELNYLAAYWTNADLLLPSGFPYHNAASNREIHDRLMQLLRLYRATPATWEQFTQSIGGRFHEAWFTSRVQSSGAGYLYHAFHRLVAVDTTTAPKWKEIERQRVYDLLTAQNSTVYSLAAANSALEPTSTVRPKMILVDEVSRALGNPDLTSYDLAFHTGEIEAWVRREAMDPDHATGVNRVVTDHSISEGDAAARRHR
ncbi:MAG: hypothetical protein IT427_00620 [Pirellulales bacterium]|nr:hypothetical protein [Pirellulales bacterium]